MAPRHRYGARVQATRIDTLRAVHERDGSIVAHCRPCGRHVWLNLAELIASGAGERRIVGLRLKCSACGQRGTMSIIWQSRR
jgi:hypothetical protein